jgi:hypothetical protein
MEVFSFTARRLYPRYPVAQETEWAPEPGLPLWGNKTSYQEYKKTNSVAFSPQVNYTD